MLLKRYFWIVCLLGIAGCTPKEITPAQAVAGQYRIKSWSVNGVNQDLGLGTPARATSTLRVRETENGRVQLSVFIYNYYDGLLNDNREINGVEVRKTPEPKQLAFKLELGEPLYDLYESGTNLLIGQIIDNSKERTQFAGLVLHLRIPKDSKGDKLSLYGEKKE